MSDTKYELGLELTKKAFSFFPNYKFVYNDNNEIIDIAEAERVITDEDLTKAKSAKIIETKIELEKWLQNNPLLYTDGNLYSVTEEKQSLLNNNLASYERATAAGIVYPLKWNSTGEECVEWEYNDLLALSLNIAAYVASKVSMQQAYEVQIKDAATIEEINEIVIDYDKT